MTETTGRVVSFGSWEDDGYRVSLNLETDHLEIIDQSCEYVQLHLAKLDEIYSKLSELRQR